MSSTKSHLIVVEGPDGAGKSTLINGLETRLKQKGLSPTIRRQPGGTPIGEALRELLLSPKLPIEPNTQALMMLASRAEYLDATVKRHPEQIHLADRLEFSTMFYQGAGVYCSKLDEGRSKTVASVFARRFIQEIVGIGEFLARDHRRKYIMVDAPDAVLNERRYGGTDRFESQTQRFLDKVRSHYRNAAELGKCRYPTEFYLVDGSKPLTDDDWDDLIRFVLTPPEAQVNLKTLYKD